MKYLFLGLRLGLIGLGLGVSNLGVSAPLSMGFGNSFGLSPFWDWKTIETENFRLSFPSELAEVAQKSARHFEEAHTILSPLLGWTPRTKTQILIVDNSDSANGLTTPLGRFGILLYATPPDTWFSTAYYDDWLRLLILHEYTHFLNMDTTTGFWSILRYIYGDVLLPNSIWPPWMLEGLAVYMETRFTRQGRGRSPFYEMVLRSAVEAGVMGESPFITLDKVNGPNPYYPGGETAYLFGYHLMNQVAGASRPGESALGEMSIRSGGRIPFFINGNLENITGKDWHAFWEDFVAETQRRMRDQLAKIRSQPLTPHEIIGRNPLAFNTLGSAVSPDGKWIAYTADALDERMSVILKNLETGESNLVVEKIAGAQLAFTPDSEFLVFSSLERRKNFYLWSELSSFHLPTGHRSFLTNHLRARDPDVSRDGNWVTFTRTETSRTGLALAGLERREESKITLSETQDLWMPQQLGRVSNPRFSADGRKIYFSLKRNGEPGEDLAVFDLGTRQMQILVSDGRRNRYPAVSRQGEVYFISDRTGVDNLYRYREDLGSPELITNVTTGIAFPTVSDSGVIYGSVFSHTGWNLARLSIAEKPIPAASVTIEPPNAPAAEVGVAPTRLPLQGQSLEVKDYSIFPSILPRQWAPLGTISKDSLYFGAQALGFDATDRHRYVVALAYDTLVKELDWLGIYSNRTLGPDLSVSASNQTTGVSLLSNGDVNYLRKMSFSASGSFPFQFTFSELTPSTAFRIDQGRSVPEWDASLRYSSARSSRLAIAPERGRTSQIGSRVYLDSGTSILKGFFADTEYLRLADHAVLVPAIAASWTSFFDPRGSLSNVRAQGRLNRIYNRFHSDSLDQLAIRGYPLRIFDSRSAAVMSVDLKFPLWRIFRGFGTYPAFLTNMTAFTFAETTYFPSSEPGVAALPSAGGGLKLLSEIFIHVPLSLSLEYHHGFRSTAGGQGEIFFQFGVSNFLGI